MKTLIVNASFSGGAAIAARNLFNNLASRSDDIYYLTLYQNNLPNHPNADSIFKYNYSSPSLTLKSYISNKLFHNYSLYKYQDKKLDSIKSYFRRNQIILDHISSPKTTVDITQHPFYKKCEVLNFHWVSGLIDFRSFFLKNGKPLLWTLHDENPYSGIFHYSPLNVDLPDWIIEYDRNIYDLKSKYMSGVNKIKIIGLSDWIIGQSKETHFSNFDHYLIPNSISRYSTSISKKKSIRNLLDIDKYEHVFLFVSDDLFNPRKGFSYLKKALRSLDDNYVLLTVGRCNKNLFEGINVYHFDYISDRKLLDLIYIASDALLLPSVLDNLPNTMLEAFSNGIPVIGFNSGGIGEYVKNNKTGVLATKKNSSSFLKAVKAFIKNKDVFISEHIQNYGKSNFSKERQYESYFSLLHSSW